MIYKKITNLKSIVPINEFNSSRTLKIISKKYIFVILYTNNDGVIMCFISSLYFTYN